MSWKYALKRFWLEKVKGEDIWDFICRDCHETSSIKRSGLPDEVTTGEEHVKCPKCSGTLSKPLHILRPWEA